jgi:hypothetical protein
MDLAGDRSDAKTNKKGKELSKDELKLLESGINVNLSAYNHLPVICSLLFGFAISNNDVCSSSSSQAVNDIYTGLLCLTVVLSLIGLIFSSIIIFWGMKLSSIRKQAALVFLEQSNTYRIIAITSTYTGYLTFILGYAICTSSSGDVYINYICTAIFTIGIGVVILGFQNITKLYQLIHEEEDIVWYDAPIKLFDTSMITKTQQNVLISIKNLGKKDGKKINLEVIKSSSLEQDDTDNLSSDISVNHFQKSKKAKLFNPIVSQYDDSERNSPDVAKGFTLCGHCEYRNSSTLSECERCGYSLLGKYQSTASDPYENDVGRKSI